MTLSDLGISSIQLSDYLASQKPLLVFDLRIKDDFIKSHVAGSVHAVCDTRAKETIMPKIPKNTKIVLISEPEKISQETAEMMVSFGLDTHYLKGGFSSWNGDVSSGNTGNQILADTLAEHLDDVFLLDVRNSDEFSEYKIPGSVNIPLDELFDSKNIQKIPRDKTIVTICPHGNRAMVASFVLERAGISTQILSGGLAGWNQFLKPVNIIDDQIKITQIQKIGKGCLSYIIESNRKAIVIDPLYPFEKYIEIAKNEGFEIVRIFDTHQHADHVSSALTLSKEIHAKLHLSKYEGYEINAEFVGDTEEIFFGNTSLKIIHTPGHTPGSLSYLIDGRYLFTGDILFVESIGRPDLRDKADEFAGELYHTLHDKLLSLPGQTMVFPTHHGEDVPAINDAFYSTIEKSKKLAWLDLSKQEFVIKVVAISIPRPTNYRKIISINKGEIPLNPAEIPDLEIGPNRCAVGSV